MLIGRLLLKLIKNKMKNELSYLKSVDLSEKLRAFEGKWVALSLDYKEVLGVGETLKEAKEQAKKKSKNYIFIKLPPFDVKYIPSF
jgi:hypothetical protein